VANRPTKGTQITVSNSELAAAKSKTTLPDAVFMALAI
jgi:hypothetical protein